MALRLVESPYFHKGAREGEVLSPSVEGNMRFWENDLVSAIQEQDNFYLSYRGVKEEAGNFGIIKQQVKDVFRTRGNAVSVGEFREQVGRALRNGDESPIPQVAAAAKRWRVLLDKLKKEGLDNDVFTHSFKRQKERIEADLARTKSAKKTAALNDELKVLQNKIDDITANGVNVKTARSYFPRVWRPDRIMGNLDEFRRIIDEDYLGAMRGVPASGADGLTRAEMTDEIINNILGTHHRSKIATDDRAISSAFQERVFDIPDELIERFLENDVEIVIRGHHRQMVADIELSRLFPEGFDLKESVQEIIDDFNRLIAEAKSNLRKPEQHARRNKLVAQLERQRERDVQILRAFRDRIRGTYGMPDDPNRPLSRGMRLMQQFNAMTMLGGAMVSSLPDIARPIMVEGFSRSLRGSLVPLIRNFRTLKMAKRELQLAGTAFDVVLNTRALAFADMTDLFLRQSRVEHAANQATNTFFLLNGLSLWNETIKSVAGMTVMMRIGEVTTAMRKGAKVSAADKRRLLKSNIDDDMAQKIGAQFEEFGENIDGSLVPNTDQWTDASAAMAFRRAIAQDVDRIIVTPGLGDRPLWTSNEYGRMIGQFKSFGMATVQRSLIPALQARDKDTFIGVSMLLGMGLAVNELKRLQFGIGGDQDLNEALADGIDRSGIFGWLGDVNNIVERLSDNKVGFRPLIGASPPYNASLKRKISSVAGPSASQLANVFDISGDLVQGEFDQYTRRAARRMIPGQNLFYLDWIFDKVERAGR
jgi:hypothetical protein